MKRYILILLTIGCLLPVSAQQSNGAIHQEPLCLLTPDSDQGTKQLVILQTSDTHSRIEPIAARAADRNAGMGGTVRRSTFIKEAREANPDLLLFDCGDIS
ncbi:MAG: bifunctional metallophosphatase/5'-nucleotidase, partial [Bacteroides sp.]|nr:bifunctional metallophosphatase/5'-nucleotidase [Bacteroides sp.]